MKRKPKKRMDIQLFILLEDLGTFWMGSVDEGFKDCTLFTALQQRIITLIPRCKSHLIMLYNGLLLYFQQNKVCPWKHYP